MTIEFEVRELAFCRKLLTGLACVCVAIGPILLSAIPAQHASAQTAATATLPAAQTDATTAPGTAAPASPTDITGTWQGTLTPPNATKGTRFVIKITKGDGGYKAALYNADQGSPPLAFNSVTLQGTDVKLASSMLTIQGKLSADGKTMGANFGVGTPNPLPLNLERTNPDAAWAIPEPLKPMAADADPSLEVATIKPNDSGATRLQGLVIRGRNFITRASSVDDLISFAYSVQAEQIVAGPGWLGTDRFDIDGVPDAEGVPNTEQIRAMIRKLLADRFQLTFHHEQREMSAYVLEVGKNGQKLTPNESKGQLPGLGFRPVPGGLTLMATNAAMPDFTGFLQVLVMDRPVVDRTGLTGRYDFQCTFTPDDSQFGGHPPMLPADAVKAPDATQAEAAPGLYEAVQQQLGLKLSAQKTSVDVIAIDHIDHPSPN